MILSIALILSLGLITGGMCKKIGLPSLIGMLLTGILLGPYVLNLLDPSIIAVSGDLRKIALVIILIRAGLSIDVSGLKKNGRPALLLCFIPATFELLGIIVMGPMYLGMNLLESALLGSVLAAVSPAVVVPRMVAIMEEGYGTKKGVPQTVLAGASVDDVYVIVLFTTFISIMDGGHVSVISFVNIPVSIILGMAIGFVLGFFLSKIFEVIHMRDSAKVVIIMGVSLLLVVGEDKLNTPITYASLIAIMFIGIGIQRFRGVVAERLSQKFGKMWVGAEIFLFVLVGASVNINGLNSLVFKAFIVIVIALVFRMIGVYFSLLGSKFNSQEIFFIMFSYIPKATVQAAIGGIPLAMGFACGDTILTVAVLAIIVTAPLGALIIDVSYKRLLTCNGPKA